jgi:GTP-binding protein Era
VRAVPTAKREEATITRSGTVAIVGRPNVGKSTLLNAALAVDLAIVSKTPQTTRENLLGVLHRTLADGTRAELLLLDTPGLHEGKTTLNKRMNRVAKQASAAADVVIMTTEVPKEAKRELLPYAPDVALVRELARDAKVVLVVNKIDRLKDKTQLFPLLEGWTRIRAFEAIVPTSALKKSGVEPILEEVGKLLPEAAHQHAADDLTDRPSSFFRS